MQEKVLPLLPDYARACVQECMDTVSWRVLVWSTRLQLCLDVSAMLCSRKALKDKPFVHYILADSSLQGDRDWLLHVSRQALQSSLPQIMQSVVQLTTDASRQARAVEDDEEGGDEPVLPSMPLDRADLFRCHVLKLADKNRCSGRFGHGSVFAGRQNRSVDQQYLAGGRRCQAPVFLILSSV